MINEKLEKLNQEIAKGEARLRRAQHEEKILEHQVKQLTRKERTHRLCTRGAMLESFLLRPEVLTDEDVMDLSLIHIWALSHSVRVRQGGVSG